ncbi:MAG: hypothetical protein VKL20_04825 [Synechocystis sp.]|nr:hypothetical protein [Synechocystis sp.]
MLQRFACLPALTAYGVLFLTAATPPSLAQGEAVIEMEEVTIEEGVGENNGDDANELRPLNQDSSILSVAGGRRLMAEADAAINEERYDIALEKLQQARKVFNQLSNFHLQLANSLSGISTPLFEEQRLAALETGQLRDEATYRLALVHRAKNEAELAVPLLIQIIRSQNPTTDLGRKSYQQLYELGFVASPFTEVSPTGSDAAPRNPVVN